MRRSALGVVVTAGLLAALLLAPPASAAFSGKKAKFWTARVAGFGQRPAGGLHERRAGRMVARRFQALGYAVRVQPFRLPNGKASRNIVARSPGPLRVVIVAHLDGVHGTQAANDNASGVGTLLEIARNLRGTRGVRFAALGAEERFATGSADHLGSLRFTQGLPRAVKEGVRLALSIDMVGVGTTLHVRGLESSPNRSARILLRRARALGIDVTYLQDSGQSDHEELTRGGVPAAWIQWRWDTCWHEPCDRMSRVNRWKLHRAGRLVLAAARRIL